MVSLFWFLSFIGFLNVVMAFDIIVDDLSSLVEMGVLVPLKSEAGALLKSSSSRLRVGYPRDGPCSLLWPLDNTDVFIHSFPFPSLQRVEKLVLSCRGFELLPKLQVRIAMDGSEFKQVAPLSGGLTEINYVGEYHINRTSSHLDITVCSNTAKSCLSHFSVTLSVVNGVSDKSWRPGPALHPLAATLDSRDDLGIALPLLVPNASTLVEVGVLEGAFAELLLNTAPNLRNYIGVDTWAPAPPEEYVDVANTESIESHESNLEVAIKRLSQFHKRNGRVVTLLRLDSLSAASLFSDESLDVVYLDAAHDYESVYADMEAWYPKVKRGGLLAGHDYLNGVQGTTMFAVRAAADKFAREKNILLLSTRDSFPTFLLIKP